MKRVLIGDNREEWVSTLESLLKNWGYRAIATESPESFLEIQQELEPDLLIVGPSLFAEKVSAARINRLETHRISIKDPQNKPTWRPQGAVLDFPVDVFQLFSMVQQRLEKIPRRNIRLNVRMPGLYDNGNGPCIAEVLSLSPEGLFLKTGTKLDRIEDLNLVLPLIGMQTELEIRGRIAYRVEPAPENNYMQGLGIEFVDLDSARMEVLEQYVEGLLFNELNERPYFIETLRTTSLLNPDPDSTLLLTPIG